jgi:predicted ABC-class ATPase
MHGSLELAAALDRIDGRAYQAYRDIEGAWRYSEFLLFIDRVQADPFAPPSKLRVRLDQSLVGLPKNALANRTRRMASASWLARAFRTAICDIRPPRTGTGKGGLITIDAGGAEVLERTAVVFGDDFVEARIELGLPAAGRRVRGNDASHLLIDLLPRIVARAWIERSDGDERDSAHDFLRFVDCIENQEFVRDTLERRGLVAFVGNGSILPRESGASERPMSTDDALRFQSPDEFAVEIEVPHADAGAPGQIWRGMGLQRGINLLVGGGYHGKSTLLRAIERAVSPHILGDGRETVVSDPGLVKIRAEDGRSVCGVDIQGFIDHLPALPGGARPRSTRSFSTNDASGSTSQAANIVEAIEAGATGLLLDEDTSATNFMVRDAKMQALIQPRDEPITPFLDRIRELFERFGISTILVMGGSGDYFEVADAVIEMKAYQPRDVTSRAKAIAEGYSLDQPSEQRAALQRPKDRFPDPSSFDARRGRRDTKLSTRGCEEIVFGTTEIDLRAIEQLFDPSQTRAIAAAIHLAASRMMGKDQALADVLDGLDHFFDAEGLDRLDPFHRSEKHPGSFARPRRFEIAAAINRMRTLRLINPS